MFVIPLIERKRDGGRLTPAEWAEIVTAYAAGRIPDYQMAALVMAVFLNGLEPDELDALTDAMCASGAHLAFGRDVPPRVDKHSTGGVGDKVSLVLAPLVSSCGVAVPMLSGRGLGHTGGTLDKLEAIPGFRTNLSLEEAQRQVERIGCVLIGQSPEIAPADRKLYALRDATATVEAIPLIAASIMSKKLAEGLSGLVLDVKRGAGSFLPDLEDALELAQTMIRLGEDRGWPTVALLTAMDRPLGRACGNALETEEALVALTGEGPDDLMDLVYALAVEMMLLAGVDRDRNAARRRVQDALGSGRAADKFKEIVEAQGGNPAIVDDPAALPHAPKVEVYSAPTAGFVARVEPRTVGRAVMAMGGGRNRMEDDIDPAVGLVITVKPGDRVERGEPVASIHARDDEGIHIGRSALDRCFEIVQERTDGGLPLISHRATRAGVEVLA